MTARIGKYPKPYVAFMDGLVRAAVSGFPRIGASRGDRATKLAMPEVGSVFSPTSAARSCCALAPAKSAPISASPARTMNGPDAIHARFADVWCASAKWPELRAALTKVRPSATSGEIRALIEGFATARGPGPVAGKQAADRCLVPS